MPRSLFLTLVSLSALLLEGAPAPSPTIHPKLNLPLAFERQGDPSKERYIAHGQGYMIALDGANTTIGILPGPNQPGSEVSMGFAGGRHVQPVAGPELPGKVNYIRGNDPSQWRLSVPTYEQIKYQDVYPGVDVVYYGNQQQLEFDLVLKPGADPRAIRMKFDGARKLSVSKTGELVLETQSGEIRFPVPKIYQETIGRETGVDSTASRKSIGGHYKLLRKNEIGFELTAYDRTKPLVIDPTIVYGALFGGNSSAISYAIALDSSGNIYLTGYTYAGDFPTTPGSAQPGYNNNGDGFVSKVNASGTAVIYSTYLGGAQFDYFHSIAVDSTGAAWVAGYTSSPDFPTMNPYQATFGGGGYDVVLAKLSSSGALQFSTYLGGSGQDLGYGVAVDAGNNAYVAGYASGGFPTTGGALLASASGTHGFVAKFNSSASIVYSTLLGGNSSDVAYAVAADSSGNAYVTGYTSSGAFTGDPGGGARDTNAGGYDAFIAKVNPFGTALLYFTFLGGGSTDVGYTIQLDASSPPNAYVGGYTFSTDLNPSAGVVGASLNGGADGFVAKLNGTGSAFSYITYLGGRRADYLESLAVERTTGDVYVTGYTNSNDFPLSSPVEAFPSNPVSLFQTTSGTSWSAFDTNIPGAVTALSPDPVTLGTLIVSTDTGIYRTTNGGGTWTSQYSLTSAGLSRSPASPGTIYAVQSGNAYLSADNGVTWNYKGYTGTFANTIVADPLTSSTAYSFYSVSSSFGYGVYKTTDSGITWTPSTTGLPSGASIQAMVAAPSGTLYAAVYQYGMYQSTNQAGTWTPINTGLPNPLYPGSGQILSVTGSVLYLSYSGTIYKSINGGTSWTPTAGSVPNRAIYVASSPSNANQVYATSSGPVLYVSSDGGTTWNVAATGLGISSITQVVFNPFSSTGAFALAGINYSTFVAKLNSTATALVYSTYLGGSNYTYGYGIATNGLGEAFVTGETSGAGFPVASALPFSSNGAEGFVVAIADATAACSYSVYPSTQTIRSNLQTVTYGVNAPSGCSWTAISNQSWATVVSGASGTGAGLVTVQATANSTGSTRSASLTINTTIATLNQSDSSCSYLLSAYSASLSNSGGSGQVNVIATTGCPWTVVDNSPAVIVTAGSSGSGNGTVSFTAAPNADLNSRTISLTIAGNSFGITETGVPVGATSVTPGSGTGAVQTFTSTYVAANGYHDLQWVQMLFAVATDGGGQSYCFVHYDVGGNAFWLYGDGGFFLGPITPGTPSNVLQNSLCALNTSGSSVSGNGTTLTVNAALVFKGAGVRNIYLRALNLEGNDSGMVQHGTWTMSAAPLGTMTVSPSSGSVTNGTQQTFTLTYPDPSGFAGAAFGWEQFLVAAASDGGGQPFCFLHYDRAGNGLWMYSSDVGFFLGPVTPGASSTLLTSSACSVNTAGTTLQNTGGNLILTVPITMKAPMVGAKKTFQRTLDVLNRDLGFVQSGTFTVN